MNISELKTEINYFFQNRRRSLQNQNIEKIYAGSRRLDEIKPLYSQIAIKI